jgi:hypothetical protein
MAIDTTTERILGFSAAAKKIDRFRMGGDIDQEIEGLHRRKTNISTLYRWSTVGCRGVVLETVQIGATRCTSVEALQRFFEGLSAGGTAVSPAGPRSSARRARQSEAAGRALERSGA